MVLCKRCGGETVKAGVRVRKGEKQQIYLCRVCGYEFWEGQEIRGSYDTTDNPSCQKCGANTQKYGYGFKDGQKVRKFRCGSCGYVFLDGPEK